MSQKGLISVNNGNLCLTGRNKIKTRYKSVEFAIQTSLDRQSQQDFLRASLIRRKYHLQSNIIQLKKDIIKVHQSKKTDPKHAKSMLKAQRKLGLTNSQLETSLKDYFTLSNRNIGNIFYRSQATGLRIQKRLNKLKLIKSERNTKIVEPFAIPYREFRERYINNKYQHSKSTGLVFRCMPNKIKMLR